MKTSFYQRMFIVVATVSAIACTEPDIIDNGRPLPPGNQVPNQTGEYRTGVTTWIRQENNHYVGLVAQVPANFWEGEITVIENGKRISVDTYFDAGDALPSPTTYYSTYYWATRQNTVMMLHYVGPGPTSPPFNLEVVITF